MHLSCVSNSYSFIYIFFFILFPKVDLYASFTFPCTCYVIVDLYTRFSYSTVVLYTSCCISLYIFLIITLVVLYISFLHTLIVLYTSFTFPYTFFIFFIVAYTPVFSSLQSSYTPVLHSHIYTLFHILYSRLYTTLSIISEVVLYTSFIFPYTFCHLTFLCRFLHSVSWHYSRPIRQFYNSIYIFLALHPTCTPYIHSHVIHIFLR